MRTPNPNNLFDESPSKMRMNYNYSKEFDLVLPNARKKQSEDLWFHRDEQQIGLKKKVDKSSLEFIGN